MTQNKALILVGAVLLLLVGYFSTFTVDEREIVLLRRLGQIVPQEFAPGLHFKMPILTQVSKFDVRILTLDVEREQYLTREKKYVIVDFFVMWRITDPAKYYTAVGGDEQKAGVRLSGLIIDGLRGEFGKRTIQEVVSGERRQIMDIQTVQANKQSQEFGITIADVRIKRIDLASDVSQSVYRRMETERSRAAKESRSRGAEAAERIRADADRQRTVTLAEAYRDAERTRGEGDAQAAQIYASAYGKNPEFYAFYRSLNAYKSVFDKASLLVLQPDSEFFRYFKQAQGGGQGQAPVAGPAAAAAPRP